MQLPKLQLKTYKEGIIEAYKFLRTQNSSIPSDIIDFIKNASLDKLEEKDKTPKTCKCGGELDIIKVNIKRCKKCFKTKFE